MKSNTTIAICIFVICVLGIFIVYQHSPEQSCDPVQCKQGFIQQKNDPMVATISLQGKTKVLKHTGVTFERLHEFCTWTLEFDCHMMKTPVGRIPFYMHKPGTDAWMSDVLAKDQARDPAAIALLMDQLRPVPDAMFVDIGSNLGVYSMVIAKTLQRRVIAVDPLVENVVRLCKTIQDNNLTDNITIVFNALSDTYAKVGFFKPFHHIEATKVMKLNESKIGGPHSCLKPTSGLTCKLDDLLPLMTSKSAVLKLDVEAHEYKILHGGQQFLDAIHIPAIYMEWVNVKVTPDGPKLVEFLKNRNYFAYPPNGNFKGAHLDFKNFLNWPFNIIWIRK